MAESSALTVKQQAFQTWMQDGSKNRLTQYLPSDVPADRFSAVVIRAVQEDPQLLMVDDQKSLFLACQRAAQDGLIPDRREGALVIFKAKKNDQYVTAVQWMPMISGVRKRLSKCGFDLVAEVVHEKDEFYQQKGDDPRIEHKPPPLGQPRGNIIGAYAIATHKTSGRKYREVMDMEELNKVRSVAKTDAVWKQWFSEQARKTVAKRLAKSLPLDEPGTDQEEIDRFRGVVDHDNEAFYDLEQEAPPAREASQRVQAAARKKVAKKQNPEPEREPIEGEAEHVDNDEPPPDEEAEGYAGVEPGF